MAVGVGVGVTSCSEGSTEDMGRLEQNHGSGDRGVERAAVGRCARILPGSMARYRWARVTMGEAYMLGEQRISADTFNEGLTYECGLMYVC